MTMTLRTSLTVLCLSLFARGARRPRCPPRCLRHGPACQWRQPILGPGDSRPVPSALLPANKLCRMARIILLHSMYGLRPAVLQAADRLRSAGHEVHTPDLFDGRVVDTTEAGREIREEIGNEELLKRAVAAAGPLSERGLVYAGFSL